MAVKAATALIAKPPKQQINSYAKSMLNKCLKYREPSHRSNDCRLKIFNLLEAEAGDVEVNDVVKDKDDK